MMLSILLSVELEFFKRLSKGFSKGFQMVSKGNLTISFTFTFTVPFDHIVFFLLLSSFSYFVAYFFFWPIHWQSILLARTSQSKHIEDLQEEFLKENPPIPTRNSASLIHFSTVH